MSNKTKIKRRRRPDGLTDWEWESNKELHKSRFFVSAKLTEINWRHFYKWETENNYNHNSALNYLIATHPELQKND